MKAIRSTGADPSLWQLLCLAAVTLISSASETPQLAIPTKQIVGLLVDGSIELKSIQENRKNGILSIKS